MDRFKEIVTFVMEAFKNIAENMEEKLLLRDLLSIDWWSIHESETPQKVLCQPIFKWLFS